MATEEEMRRFTSSLQASGIDMDRDASRMMTMDLDAMQACHNLSTEEATMFRERLAVLDKAHTQFSMRAAMGQSNFNFERLYQDLHNDIIKHEDYWFNHIFKLTGIDSKYTERTVGILGTLATILRQRGEVKKALKILKLDRKVLERYQEQSKLVPQNYPQNFCCDSLTYKFNLIVINTNQQLGIKEPAIKAFREAVTFEIQQKYGFDQQNFGFMLHVIHSNNPNYMSMKVLKKTSDEEIWMVLMKAMSYGGNVTNSNADLRKCKGCSSTEKKRGDYQICSRCKTVHYCGRECQKKDWKHHKLVCGSSAK
jgi:hypothetical protein